jgi:hypothetical protein
MAEQVITLKNIYALPVRDGVEKDEYRLWLPVTERYGKGRRTVRVPFPVGDYEVECDSCHGIGKVDCPSCGGTGLGIVCDHCGGTGVEPTNSDETPTDPCDPTTPNGVCTKCHADKRFVDSEGLYHLPCETCDGTAVVECPHCHGIGGGVMTVSPNGVIQLRYDDTAFAVNTDGLTIKVDGKTIKIGDNGLEVNADAIVPPSGYLKARSDQLMLDSDTVIKPKAIIPSITGKKFSMDKNGLVTPSIDTIGGFVAKLTINIDNPNYEDGTDLIKYEVTGGGSSWNFVMDTTRPCDSFEAGVVVTENLTAGISFTVKVETGHFPTNYQAYYSVDVHSF